MIFKIIGLTFAILMVGQAAGTAQPKPLAADERLLWFPALATPDRDGWQVTLSGLISEDESRPALSWLARKLLGFSHEEIGPAERAIFRERTQRFFADDERGKRVQVDLFGARHDLGETGPNGHFGATIHLPRQTLRAGQQQALHAVVFANGRVVSNFVQVCAVSEKGISVVSDIDDTIKISQVRDREELMRNTFLRPFRPVDGMADVYQQWFTHSAVQFHYVSGSPWQLLPALQTFIETNRFPEGSWHLRNVRLLDSSAMELLKTPDVHKRTMIEELFARLPDRQFVLVGDSGERDPEICADLLRRHPKRVVKIFIRDVTGETKSSERYRKAFQDLPEDSWSVFKSSDELPRHLEK